MSSAAGKSNSHVARASIVTVSAYDRAAGMLIALLILLGITVLVLAFIWLAGKFTPGLERTVPVVLHEGNGGDPTSNTSQGTLIEAPPTDELSRTTDLPLESFQETLSSVEQLVKIRNPDLTQLLQLDPVSPPSPSRGTGNEPAAGVGGGPGGVAREHRWEIYYGAGVSPETYARQLDFFGIELAAMSPDGRVEYVRNLSQPSPLVDRDRKGTETRLFMSWREGSARREADRRLLEQAGVVTAGKSLLQFIPSELESRMLQMEFDYAKRPPILIRKTRFAVRASGGGFELYVDEQIPR